MMVMPLKPSLDTKLTFHQSKIYLTLFIASRLTLAIPTANAGPTGAQVTNAEAFTSGAGNKEPNLGEGAAGTDSYTCYTGGWQSFPDKSKWVSFTSMFDANKPLMKSRCAGLGVDANTDAQIENIHDAILEVAKASLIDPRFGLAIVIQEVCHAIKLLYGYD